MTKGCPPRGLSTVLAATLLLAACNPPPSVERDPAPLLQTDTLAYELVEDEAGFRTTIPYTYRNETGGAVYLANCNGDVRPLLEMDRNGFWFPAWEPFRTDCLSPPVVIGPGETYADTLHLRGAPPASNLLPVFVFPEIQGVYRMVWFQAHAALDSTTLQPSDPLPLEQRVSNPFVLRR